MKIVLDTNVLVSGIFWGGVPEKILELAMNGAVEIYATEEILNEYFRIIERIGKKDKDLCSQWKMLLMQIVKIVEPVRKMKICRDPKDDMFLECAVSSEAEYIVSGDDDLLSLEMVDDIQIVTAKRCLEMKR